MKSSWIHVLSVALLTTVVAAQPAAAAVQDTPAQTDDTQAARDTEAAEGEADGKKFEFGLYVEVGHGSNNIETMDTTLRTSSSQASSNSLTFDDMDLHRAAVGWKLPGKKGRFRLVFTAFNENGYDFTAIGREARANAGGAPVLDELDWWTLNVTDGNLTVEQTPPVWTPGQDANMDGSVQADEVTYPFVTFSNSISIEPNLQNRTQVVDVLFGNEFGPRRVEGVWWGGMRYFAYEGVLLQGAWLRSQAGLGEGFTDGVFLRLIHSSQKTTAIGPTGSLGLQVNFLEKRLQLFMAGQFAFLLSNIEVDTGQFFTVTRGNTLGTVFTGPAQLTQKRDRTSWHTHIEAGVRVNLKNGLIFEATYYQGGFLDAVITPTEVRIPQNAQELALGSSAIFATQDLRYDGWRGSLAFQF